MCGRLIRRFELDFDGSSVLMLSPTSEEKLDQGGSVELEAFAHKDIRIPYAAIMAIYETDSSISMVHSYSRTYSPWEIEENRTISDGHEGCWSLRDTSDVYSFAVLHNGIKEQTAQRVRLQVKNSSGETIVSEFSIPQLNPFETLIVKPVDHISGLASFLKNKPGSATIDFNLNGSFTRLLVGWHSISGNQLQVTHSNFNYAIHETDLIETEHMQTAYMKLPCTPFESQAVIYPDFSPGSYKVQSRDKNGALSNPVLLGSTRTALAGSALEFYRVDGILPSRIVTALERVSNLVDNTIPFECSLNVVHQKRPPKRFHWGLSHTTLPSILFIVAYPEVYGDPGYTCQLSVKCMLLDGVIHEEILNWDEIQEGGRASLLLTDIFPLISASERINNASEFCYITIYSAYGGFLMYTAILKGTSWTFEHTF